MEISKSLAQVGSAQEDKKYWKSQDLESQTMAKAKLYKLKWLFCDCFALYEFFSVHISHISSYIFYITFMSKESFI